MTSIIVKISIYVIIIFSVVQHRPAIADSLDAAYRSPEKIVSLLFDLEEEYPDYVRVDSIGHSSEYELPVYMAKLSDNPDEDEPEASLLIIGQIHAEEILGIELILELMLLLLENNDSDPYRERLNNLQLFFIPTMNPEGLRVVHSEDITFRKNCRDNIGDGVFRFQEGAGWDTSGVDLNRNFGLHWDLGDTLFQQRDPPYVYNYYAGPAPFSEPEARAVRDLALEHRFQYSINYHSSRSGNNAEMVIGPWYWEGRYPVDRDAIDDLGDQLAFLIPTADGENNYEFVNATQRNGQSPDWLYQATGTFQYMIEIGSIIQPDSAEMRAVVEDNLTAAFYLMDLALGVQELDTYGTLTIIASDVANDEPLEAIILIDERIDPIIENRRTSANNGRFDWLLPEGQYNVTIGKFGYRSITRLNFDVPEGRPSVLRARLVPLQRVRTTLTTIDAETHERIESILIITDEYGADHIFPVEEGEIEFDFPIGSYPYKVLSDDYLPVSNSFCLDEDAGITISMNPSEVVFIEDFNMSRGWLRGGTGGDWGIKEVEDRIVLNESEIGLYQEEMDSWLLLDPDISLDTLHASVIKIVHRPYFEPGHDFGYIRAEHPGTGEWMELAEYSEFPNGWRTDHLPLISLGNGRTRILFNVTSDSRVEEDGWLIDQLEIHSSLIETPVETFENVPVIFSLVTFPNPFNNSTTISLNLPVETTGMLSLFDLTGREITVIHKGVFQSGRGIYHLNSIDLTSGCYLLLFKDENRLHTQRISIIR